MRTQYRAVLVIFMSAFALTTTLHAGPTGAVDRWEGAIHYKGGAWPILADLKQIEQGEVLVSYPALGIGAIASPAGVDDENTCWIEFGYGIGRQQLSLHDGQLLTEARVADTESVAVVLHPDGIGAASEHVIAFESQGLELVGSLFIPSGQADMRNPLVVVGHGASPYQRDMVEYSFWAEHLTRRGFAVFLYDKRGLGESAGTYPGADLVDIQQDLASAIDAAATDTRVDPERVALLGGSQFGWTAFAGAAKSKTNERAILLSAPPGVDPISLEERVLELQLRRNDIKGAELAQAMGYVRLYFAACAHPGLYEPLVLLANESKEENWINHVPVPESADDLSWWGRQASFDHTEDVLGFGGPVQVIYGREDQIAPPDLNAMRLEQLIKAGGGTCELWIAPEGDHRIEVPARMIDGKLRFPMLAQGYLNRVDQFLEAHLKNIDE